MGMSGDGASRLENSIRYGPMDDPMDDGGKGIIGMGEVATATAMVSLVWR